MTRLGRRITLAEGEPTIRSRRTATELRAAEHALEIVLQPVIDLESGAVAGAEALSRFRVEPMRSPDLWFAEAWVAGIGVELECAALEKALLHLETLPRGAYLALNVSPRTLVDARLQAIAERVPGERVVLELTEHERIDDYAAISAAIARARSRGMRLSVDDAGAGFASFHHILELKPDLIKLDRSLTRSVDTDRGRYALAAAFVSFAKNLGASICAEGVETPDELRALQRLGVRYGQGYLLGRPLPPPLARRASGWPEESLSPDARPNALPDGTPERREADLVREAVSDPARLAVLRETGLLGSDAEEVFDRFAQVAARLLHTPIALVSLVDEHHQFLKSSVGLPEPLAARRETPLSHSFCKHVVTKRAALAINDAQDSPFTREQLVVGSPGVRAYLGVPIVTHDDHALGALCAVDPRPRIWTTDERETLRHLAEAAASEIDQRRALRAARRERVEAPTPGATSVDPERRAREALHARDGHYRTLLQHLPGTSVALFDHDLRFVLADGDLLLETLRVSRQAIVGRKLHEVSTPRSLPSLEASFRTTLSGEDTHFELRRDGRCVAFHTAPTRDDHGVVTGGIVVLTDITARDTAERQLKRLTEGLALLGDVATFTNRATTSHEAYAYALERVGGYLGSSVGHAYVREADELAPSEVWHLVGTRAREAFQRATRTARLGPGVGLPGRVLASRKTEWRREGASPDDARSIAAREAGLAIGLAFPVLVATEVAAVLELYTEADVPPDASALALAAQVGEQLGRIVERERAERARADGPHAR